MSIFNFVNDINYDKKNIMHTEEDEKKYNSFMTNKALSYFNDTVLFANEMNLNYNLDNKLKYDFLFHTIRKRKRFSKWHKKDANPDILVIKQYYNISERKAYDVIHLLDENDIKEMKKRLCVGGKNKN